MTQAPIFGVPRSGPVAPDVMAGRIDDNFDAQISSHSGASRPTYAVAGTLWLSTATAGKHKYYFFDGTSDRLVLTIDTATGAVTYNDGVGDDPFLKKTGGTMSGAIDLAGNALKNAGDGVADYLRGLITTRASATQVSVAAGEIKGNGRFVKNTGALAKNINATWAAGNSVGGMESGFTVAANLTYHLHALRKISDGTFEWTYSPNTTLTTIPTGYEWVGRFWSVYTNASSQIFDYTQVDNTCLMAQVQWFSTTSTLSFAVSTVPVAVPLPGGIRTKALLTLSVQVNTVSCSLVVTDGDDTAGNSGSGVSCQGSNTAGASNAASRGLSKTNTTRQLGRAVSGTSSGSAASIGGWEDYTLPRVA